MAVALVNDAKQDDPLTLYCIGAQKAGTTWLYRLLRSTGRVAFPLRKEAHYWDWVELGKRPRQDDTYWKQLNEEGADYAADFTPDYAVLSVDLIETIVKAKPDIQVILLLRDPVDRAWSAARMAMDYAKLDVTEVSDDWLTTVALSKASQLRGNYALTIQRWLQVLPREQFHVYGFGDIINSPGDLLEDISRQLHLPLSRNDFNSNLLMKRFNAGSIHQIPPATAQSLRSLYKPLLEQLQEQLTIHDISFNLMEWSALPSAQTS